MICIVSTRCWSEKQSGFTLTDIAITLVIITLLAALSIASLPEMVEKNEQQLIADELTAVIQFAKNQAFLSRKKVSIKPLNADNNWAEGVSLLHKNTLIRQWHWHYPRWHIAWRGLSAENMLLVSDNLPAAMQNGRFIITNMRTHASYTLVLNRLGRVRISESESMPMRGDPVLRSR